MKKAVLLFSILTLTLSSTVSQAQVAKSGTEVANGVPYTVAKGYFVKNDVKSYLYQQNKFEFKKDFDLVFGMATTMGESGKPTAIDFTKDFVISVVENPSDKKVQIKPVSLKKVGANLEFKYKLVKGKKQSYTTQPALLLVVNRSFDGDLKVTKVK